MKNLLLLTVYISLFLQFVIGITTFSGAFFNVKPKDQVLKDILNIETAVQFIEIAFYLYLSFSFFKIKKNTIASKRYLDWVITTPIMLISTVLFMIYNNDKKSSKEPLSTMKILIREKFVIFKIVLYNFLMLLFGFLGEIGMFSKYLFIPIGFIFFFLSFWEIWNNYARFNEENRNLYYFLIIVWALYGVAAMFSVIPKNIMYNILDIISKNFYGLFIYYKLYQIKIN